MKNKESLYVRIVKSFYGITGPLDEYREQEINQVGNRSFLILYWYNLLSSVLVLILSHKIGASKSLIILLGGNAISIMGISIYISWKISSLKINQIEVSVDDDYPKLIRRLKLKALLAAVMAAAISRMFNFLTDNDHQTIWENLTSLRENLSAATFMVIFGVSFYYMTKKAINRNK